MKKLWFIGVLLLAFTAQAQITQQREQIEGKVNVGRNGDAGGINVFNLSSGNYTFTNEYGEFRISVKEGDKLTFSSVQYQQFTVVINKSVLKKGKLNINLHTGVTELKEVEVKPNLSGDVSVDVKALKTQKNYAPQYNTDEIVQGYEYEFRPDRWSKVKNDAIDKGYLQNGINFVNLFKTMFQSKKKSPERSEKDIDVEVRKMYNDDFFRKYLDIDEDHINEFLFYLESHGLTNAKLQKLNDLQLIEFILKKGKAYKAQRGE